ncbi:MAG: hypothetical protein L0229_21780 [Blastocatellia bacterium]|nr:hypothetical protein [Blastocatellia bacterium]
MPTINGCFETQTKRITNEAEDIEKGAFACSVPAYEDIQATEFYINIRKASEVFNLNHCYHSNGRPSDIALLSADTKSTLLYYHARYEESCGNRKSRFEFMKQADKRRADFAITPPDT